jgi:hypothetical protein
VAAPQDDLAEFAADTLPYAANASTTSLRGIECTHVMSKFVITQRKETKPMGKRTIYTIAAVEKFGR